MGATTSRLGLPYPVGTDPADVPNWMQQLATTLDGMITPTTHGPLASRPVSSGASPGIPDRQYWATDVDPRTIVDRQGTGGQMFRDNGAGWDPVGPFASKYAIGSFNPPNAPTATFDTTTVGFQPKLVRFTISYNDQSDTAFALGIGAAMSPSNRRVFYIRGSSGSELRRRIYTNRCIVELDGTGAIIFSADFVAFLANGFRLNFTVVTGSVTPANHLIAWEAYG